MTIRTYQYQVQALVQVQSLNKTVNTNLNLLSEGEDGVRRFASNTLGPNANGLIQNWLWETQVSGAYIPTSELELVSEADAIHFKGPSNDLGLVSEVDLDILATKTPTSQLELSMTSTASFTYGVRNFSIDETLTLSGAANRIYEPEINQFIYWQQEACRLFTGESDLNLVGEAFRFNLSVSSDLDLTDSLLLNKSLTQVIVDADVVQQAVAWYVEKPCNRLNFMQMHGEGGVEHESKRLQYDSTFLLQSIDDGTIVQLRNPETDDRQRYAFNRINRNFFDGTPDIFVDDNWATEQSQTYTIVANKREQLEELFVFLQDNLGREVLLKDWKGTTWVVIITNPGTLYTEDAEGYWTLDFDVEGEAFDGEWIFTRMELTDDNSRAGSIFNRVGSDTLATVQQVGREYPVDGDYDDPDSPLSFTTDASFVIE